MVTKLPPPSGKDLFGENPGSTRATARTRATSKRSEVARNKAEVLSLYEKGHTVEDACRLIGKSKSLWDYYRRVDPDFKAAGDLIGARRVGARAAEGNRDISFEDFREKYLHTKTYRHQRQWIDLIEGREPSDLHSSQTYKKGDPDAVIMNTPPGHAKSTTITMDYVTYKIATNPEFRVVIISKTETMAKKFLMGIKRRLTNRQYQQLQVDYAPAEGFEKSAEMWSSKMIYFGHSDSDQKDPNVEVLGIGQQIYGARADLIILDDVADVANAHQYEAHMTYIMQDVMTRDAPLIIVGTRVAPVDIYSELMNPEHYDGEESDWTYLSQPAVLSFAEDPKDWVTLWPRTDRPHPVHPGEQAEDGSWSKWDGERLAKLRRKLRPALWALVYMQQAVPDDATFTLAMVNGCQGERNRTQMPKINNPYVVAGLDPATSAGFTACVVLAVDRDTGKRYLVDVFNRQVRPAELRNLITGWTEKYNINEWRIERNAFQAFLTQDPEITQFLAARGVRLREHTTTGANKYDPEWGVTSLDTLFQGWEDGHALLDLPSRNQNEAYRALREQLITWYPDHPKTQKTDLVMALWFAETQARQSVRDLHRQKQFHLDNDFLSENDRDSQVVIDINRWLIEQRESA